VGLRLANDWLWDFWVAHDGADYHLFYLRAPRTPADPERRHWQVRIGHAVSRDLTRWELLPDALSPGPAGSWDDYTTWTGSVLRDGSTWTMLYTGTSRAENGLVQRIGRAISDDLVRWERQPAGPIIEADRATYETLDGGAWHEQAWRDPFLFRDPASGEAHALITARARSGPPATRGVIALARFAGDAGAWDVLPPVTPPGRHGHMEIPQLIELADGRWYLLYSAPPQPQATAADASGPPSATPGGTHFLSAGSPLGPFAWETHGVLLADTAGTWYGAKLVDAPDGELVCLAWRARGEHGEFVGELSDPMPVELGPGGPVVIP
jgi:beta-fructofuranosidase